MQHLFCFVVIHLFRETRDIVKIWFEFRKWKKPRSGCSCNWFICCLDPSMFAEKKWIESSSIRAPSVKGHLGELEGASLLLQQVRGWTPARRPWRPNGPKVHMLMWKRCSTRALRNTQNKGAENARLLLLFWIDTIRKKWEQEVSTKRESRKRWSSVIPVKLWSWAADVCRQKMRLLRQLLRDQNVDDLRWQRNALKSTSKVTMLHKTTLSNLMLFVKKLFYLGVINLQLP